MDWQFTEDRPIWQQLTDQLALRILKGEYPPGERLPGVRELAAQAGVNPNTMQRPGTHSVDQAGLELRNPPAAASQVLGLKACATTAWLRILF